MADAISITIGAKDVTEAAFKSVEGRVKSVGGVLSGLTNLMGGVTNSFATFGLAANGVKAVGDAFSRLASPLTKGNAQFEDYNVQFATLIKNSDDFKNKFAGVTDQVQLQTLATQAAKDKMAELAQFGATTPFDLPGVVDAQRVLMGFGLAADNSKSRFGQAGSDILRIAGDVSSGTGTDFKEMALNIGKFSAGATGEAISRFQELGITTRTELAGMGLTFSKSGELIVKNQEDMDHATSILLQVMKNKYGGLMTAQSSTFNGMMSNAQDWVQGTIREVSKPLFEPAKKALKNFLDFTASPAGQLAVKKLTGYVQSGVGTISKAFNDAKVPVQVFLAAFNGTEVDGIKGFDSTVGILAERLGTLTRKVWEVYKAFSPINTAIEVFKGIMTGGLQGGLDAFEKHIIAAGDAFGINLRPAIDWFNTTVVQKVLPTMQEWGRVFIDDWWPKIRDAVGFVIGKVGEFWDFISVKAWPPLKSFLGWLGEQWDKVGKSIGETWENTIKPALTTFGDYITKDLWPKLRDDVFPWIDANVRPKLETAFSIIADVIIPNIGKFIDLVLNRLIPGLIAWWGVLAILVKPAFDILGKVFDGLAGSLKDNKDSTQSVMDTFGRLADKFKKDVIPVLEKLAGVLHAIWWLSGGWAVELVVGNIGGIGDVANEIERLKKIIEGPTSDDRLKQYMKDHPNYDPVAAGNAPKKALGTTGFSGGPVWWGEGKGWEQFQVPGGPVFYSNGPVYSPNAGAGTSITPMGGMGEQINIHNHLTINGNPDRAMLSEIDRRVASGVKKALSEVKGNAQNLRVVNRTRG